MSRTLRRPMFRRGGPANDGIMSGIEDRKKFQDDPLKNFDVENVGKSARGFIEQFEPLLREYTPKTRLPPANVKALELCVSVTSPLFRFITPPLPKNRSPKGLVAVPSVCVLLLTGTILPLAEI